MTTVRKSQTGNNVITQQPSSRNNIRRSVGSQSQLRSPSVKRPLSAPVTIQGWLYKQGSEGFMLWRKRWFVLSEYCLFYYKNTDEDKLLGSILLPSYKISPCSAAEGKLFKKKYTFKAEHANMRTYYFAAETRELMVQWMNALSLATILQQTNSSKSSKFQRDREHHINNEERVKKLHQASAQSEMDELMKCGGASNGWRINNAEGSAQPLYANAPPKPRRLTEPYEQTNERIYGEKNTCVPPRAQPQQEHLIRNDRPYPTYASSPCYPAKEMLNNTERRTPEVYGRSSGRLSRHVNPDYEELYNITMRNNGGGNNKVPLRNVNNRHKDNNGRTFVSRPHSADFLDMDSKYGVDTTPNNRTEISQNIPIKTQPQRPKSSIDIVNTSESFHWSEESYAQKMRKTAPYFTPRVVASTGCNNVPLREPSVRKHNISPKIYTNRLDCGDTNEFMRSVSVRMPREKQALPITTVTGVEDKLYHARKSNLDITTPVHEQEREESMKRLLEWKQKMLQSPLQRKSSGSSNRGSAQVELSKYYKERTCPKITHKESWNQQNRTDGYWDLTQTTDKHYKYHAVQNKSYTDEAGRYSSYSSDEEMDEEKRDKTNVDKTCNNSMSENTEENSDDVLHSDSGYDTLKAEHEGKKMENNVEKCENIVQKRIEAFEKSEINDTFKMQTALKAAQYSTTQAHVSKIYSYPENEITSECNDSGLETSHIMENVELKENQENTSIQEHQEECGRKDISKIVIPEDVTDCSEIYELAGKKSKERKSICTYEDHYLPMAPSRRSQVSTPSGDLLSHSRTNSASSASQVLILETLLSEDVENSYVEMTMTDIGMESVLKENVDQTKCDTESSQMTRNSIYGESNKSHYEFLYKAISSQEPLYMEVGHVNENSSECAPKSIKSSVLPDILNSPGTMTISKSDSSDADDEASKELDPLDITNHPRFSLSDTFRPASYYLGGSINDRNITFSSDQPDSSDSDLVSPPPIPTSPPPLDELDMSLEGCSNTDLSSLTPMSNQKLDNLTSYQYPDIRKTNLKRYPVSADIIYALSTPEGESSDVQKSSSDLESTDFCGDSFINSYCKYIDQYRQANSSSFDSTTDTVIITGWEDDKPTSNDNPPGETEIDENVDNQGAPYYYADLLKLEGKLSEMCIEKAIRSEISTLNNQRESINNELAKRNDIGRKVNEIGANELTILPDKDLNYNLDKNIYNCNVFDKAKVRKIGYRSQTPEPLSDAVNLYARGSSTYDLQIDDEQPSRRRSRSLDRLLDAEQPDTQVEVTPQSSETTVPQEPDQDHSSDVWDKDEVWREKLRNTTIRHSRSLDDLDKDKKVVDTAPGRQSADILSQNDNSISGKRVSRHVTYVNDCVTSQMRKAKQSPKEYMEDYREVRKIRRQARPPTADNEDTGLYERLDPRATIGYYQYHRTTGNNIKQHGEDNCHPKTGSQSFLDEGQYPTKPPLFEIDREKLRQWDLMSSAPVGMPAALQKFHQLAENQSKKNAFSTQSESIPPNSPASGSDSMIGRDPLPPRHLHKQHGMPSSYAADAGGFKVDRSLYSGSPSVSDVAMKKEDSTWNVNVSAGDLLGRTHEELVLLLIQLRRQTASISKALDNCNKEIESQARLAQMETNKKIEHVHRLDELRKRIIDLERQYEKRKPLVNLVDSMVKLGSLYQAGVPLNENNNNNQTCAMLREKLEFNHKVQEQRLLADDKRNWERIHPDHDQLQSKVEQLYTLDKLLQEESNTLRTLKQDKESLENALGGLKHKVQNMQANGLELERYRKQQQTLQRELSVVRSVLAKNSKKLEETVASNAKLEAELVVLRQKVQWNQRMNQDSFTGASAIASLEAELKRVQLMVGDLQEQRNELSWQVRNLTEKSYRLSEEIRPALSGVAGVEQIPVKKKVTSGWLETDLDSEISQDSGLNSSPLMVNQQNVSHTANAVQYPQDKRLGYAGSNYGNRPEEMMYCRPMDINEADEKVKRFYGIVPREKPQEIKTVRIVKRESERRQRDRDRNGNIGIPLSSAAKRLPMLHDEVSLERLMVDEITADHRQSFSPNIYNNNNSRTQEYTNYEFMKENLPSDAAASSKKLDSIKILQNIMVANNSKSNTADDIFHASRAVTTLNFDDKFEDVEDDKELIQPGPVYQSEAAKEIIQEIVLNDHKSFNGNTAKRLVPREKRRHHTVSGTKPVISPDAFTSNNRSRDDVDMERALRPRLNGAPDVVRSTLSKKEPTRYSAETIDNLFGTPGKILIPERYVPESVPQLTKEEQDKRSRKAEAIRKMLSESASNISATEAENDEEDSNTYENKRKKLEEEKKQRDHILQLNQILAQQVMEKSKMVAGTGLPQLHN